MSSGDEITGPLPPLSLTRAAFLALAHDQLGKPYIWNADGPDYFDCSGLVKFLLHEQRICDWRATHRAQDIFNVLPPTEYALPGDFVFYGSSPKHVDHVMIYWGDGRVLGASGGNHHITTVQLAREKDAMVRFRKSRDYRPDFIGYRVAPLDFPPPVSEEPNG